MRLVTEEEESVANNTGWSPRGTTNFDLTAPGKINTLLTLNKSLTHPS